MTIYDRMRGRADSLLAKYAQGTVVVHVITPGIPDPAQPWVPVPPSSEIQAGLDAVIREVPKSLVDGTTVIVGDLLVTFAVPSVNISVGDQIVIDGKPLGVVQVMPIPPAGTAVAMQVVART